MTAAQDLFWLAHYAYNTINPLVEEAQAIEPTIQLSIETVFGHAEAAHTKQPKVNVHSHWRRDGMFLYAPTQRTKADIDKLAESLRGKVDRLILENAVAELETV